ncbi:unnamed protein product [Cuscuta europaea]|uniref:Uncharacterized protein n=1 Tax=Cuscuta europaea TaxID=41803 RepID=A0A9P0YKU1_CUSEU|nr:unnamed protein product [Cuscuta europaea]
MRKFHILPEANISSNHIDILRDYIDVNVILMQDIPNSRYRMNVIPMVFAMLLDGLLTCLFSRSKLWILRDLTLQALMAMRIVSKNVVKGITAKIFTMEVKN